MPSLAEQKTLKCFGFYGGSTMFACGGCTARTRCKSLLLSTGFELLAGTLEEIIDALPEGDYPDHDRITELTECLLKVDEFKEKAPLMPHTNVYPEDVTVDLI